MFGYLVRNKCIIFLKDKKKKTDSANTREYTSTLKSDPSMYLLNTIGLSMYFKLLFPVYACLLSIWF